MFGSGEVKSFPPPPFAFYLHVFVTQRDYVKEISLAFFNEMTVFLFFFR